MNLETELFTLQDSNAKLVAALHEANANVEQWKKQLAAYQDETERLREQVRPQEYQGINADSFIQSLPSGKRETASPKMNSLNNIYSYTY